MKSRAIIIVMVFALIICGVYALRAVSPPQSDQPEIPSNVALLDENTRRIDNGGGKYTLIYQNNQNYTKNGVVYPFDLTIRNSEVQGFDYEVENKVKVLLSGFSDGAYRIEHEGDFAEFELANIVLPVNAVNAGSLLRFTEVFPKMDVIQQPVNLGLKETVVLKNSGASSSLTTLMRTDLTPESMPDGSIFLMFNETPIFHMPAPSAVDADGVPFAAAYSLVSVGDDYSVTLSVDLDSAGVAPAFPVEIDPTITFNNPTNIKDAQILGYSAWRQLNYGASQTIPTGFYYDGGQSIQDSRRSLIEFTDITSSIPSNASISSAGLKLYRNSTTLNGSSFNVQLFKITEEWTEGNQDGSTGICCWDSARSGDSWTGGTYAGQVDTTTHRGTTGWHDFDVTDVVAEWVAGTSNNYGILLRDSVETGIAGGNTNRHYFRSSDYTGSEKPELVVSYTVSDTFTIAAPTGRAVDLNDTIRVPVYVVSGLSASDSIVAVDFSVVYTPELVKVVDIDTVGTLLGGASYFEAKDTVGIRRVSATKSSGFSGSNDTLAFLEFAATNVSYADTNGTDLVIIEPSLGALPVPTHLPVEKSNGNLKVVKLLYGDVNLSGGITAGDASLILQYITGIVPFGTMNFLAAEVSGDSCVTSYDATLILRKLLGYLPSFPAGDTLFVN